MFDINWSRKIKITINGKEYARLEDVPEEFRALLKDIDGDGIPDVSRQGKRAWRVAGFISLSGASEPWQHLMTVAPRNAQLLLPCGGMTRSREDVLLLKHSESMEPAEINRSALIVTAKQPFIEWLHRADPTRRHISLSEVNQEATV